MRKCRRNTPASNTCLRACVQKHAANHPAAGMTNRGCHSFHQNDTEWEFPSKYFDSQKDRKFEFAEQIVTIDIK